MYLEEERSEVISCIFSLKEEVGALAKALRLFEVTLTWNITPPGTQLIFRSDFTHTRWLIRRHSCSR